MSTINKILIVLDVYNDYRDDPDHQPIEIKKALALLGENSKAKIYLTGCGFEEYLHDSYSNFGPAALEQRKAFCKEMEVRLQLFAHTLIEQGFEVECHVHWTYPRFEQIANEAAELNVDLVVQHVNTQGLTERHNLSHDSWQLLKTCKKPMLLIRDQQWSQQHRVLAAVDPVHSHHKQSGLDDRILESAIETAERLAGECHVIHAYVGTARPFANKDEIHNTHDQAMKVLLADYKVDQQNIHLLDETPQKAILHCQQSIGADIVVLGALSRSRLSDAIIGNTADRVLDYIKSDLYIIRPK